MPLIFNYAWEAFNGDSRTIVQLLGEDATARSQLAALLVGRNHLDEALTRALAFGDVIKEMQEAGYKPAVIQDALGLTRQGVSNHRVVIEQLPDDLIRLIGPAHGTGRRQWGDLAALASKVPLTEVARTALAALPQDATSADRFSDPAHSSTVTITKPIETS